MGLGTGLVGGFLLGRGHCPLGAPGSWALSCRVSVALGERSQPAVVWTVQESGGMGLGLELIARQCMWWFWLCV